ncbi:MAG: GtrA family protein [Butyrivibrio sp.]|nr:GtrA family protein [Butyrivibrio sp.]
MGKLKQLYEKNKTFIMEVIHFCIVGVINTLMGLIIIEILYNLIHFNYWASSGISYFIGGVFSYFANAKVTFKVEEKDRDKWLPVRFAVNIVVCYLIAYGVAKPLVRYVLSSQPVVVVENIAIIVGMVLFTAMNFFGQKFFVFKKVGKEGAI